MAKENAQPEEEVSRIRIPRQPEVLGVV